MASMPSDAVVSETAVSEALEGSPTPQPSSFPPYPPYATEPVPASVADTIIAGRDLRVTHKFVPRKPSRPPPKPARPRGPKATDVKMTRAAMKAHARCLRRHGAVLTDRLEHLSKPARRTIICLWRDNAEKLPADTINRLRSMLDADEPFKPDQAYEYFINLRKTKKRNAAIRVNQVKKDVMAMCADKRFIWTRNATVAFARGIQQRLARPGRYVLADKMLRLSNIVMGEISGFMHMKPPSRRCTHPKAKFLMEMCDKVAVWIDEMLAESEDRMLMMDFDEDDDVTGADAMGGGAGDDGFADDFLNMMGGGGLLKGPPSAYLKFTGEMLEAFKILTDSMYKKGDEQLLEYGKYKTTYSGGADELKEATDFEATEYNTTLAGQLNADLHATAKPNTPSKLVPYMKEMIEICGNYLAQHAEFNKDKGPAFKLLVKAMKTKPNDLLYQKEKARRTYGAAATELEVARGLESDHDEPNLSQKIHSELSKLVATQTPEDLKSDMKETLDISSKYLSQRAVDEVERGPAFDILIKQLQKNGSDPFTPDHLPLDCNFAVAYTLKSAPGLTVSNPDSSTIPIFKTALHRVVDVVTPKKLKNEMDEVVDRCSKYLSSFVRDREKAKMLLIEMMKKNPTKEVAKRKNYTMTYGTGATEIESAPTILPFLPIKDIGDEAKGKLTNDMENKTPSDLKQAMKSMIRDAAGYLSQCVAIRSGVAGERYPLNFLAATKESLGTRPLYKYKSYGQTYADGAEVLKYAGPLEYDPKSQDLQYQISSEMNRGVPTKLAPTIVDNLSGTMDDAAKHLAKVGMEKGQALEYLVKAMKEEGDAPLGNLQGYQQSYNDGARRIENSTSLKNDHVDKGAYEAVRGKLTALTEQKPSPENAKYLPGIVDESSKFLAAPFPQTDEDKRRVLADLMARKGDEMVGQEGLYKMTYTEGGDEIMKAPVGVITSVDEGTRKGMLDKVTGVIPEKKLQDALKDPVQEGAAHLTDILKGRGEAMQVIHDQLKKEKGKDFLTVGKFHKTHDEAATMLSTADHFGGQHPSPVLLDSVNSALKTLNTSGGSPLAQSNMADTSDITAAYIAGVATDQCGLDAKALAALSAKGTLPVATSTTDDDEARRLKDEEERRRLALQESEEERRRRLALEKDEEEKRRRLALGDDETRRRLGQKDEEDGLRLETEKSKLRRSNAGEVDPEREAALAILHKQLKSHGGETLYKQPHVELSHSQASDWLKKPPVKVDKSVKESGDTDRLHKKFERKLSNLVSKATPSEMSDSMQDVVIESSRILSERFVSSNYKALVREALISEMQKRGNEILIDVDGAAETFFFAAQRLKKAKTLETKEPCNEVAYHLTKKLEDMIRCRSMARKLTATMKDHIKVAAEYLSELVTKPDDQIEAYVTLLGEMEAAGDALLIEGSIPKSYKDSAAYLRQLISFDDHLNRRDRTLQSNIVAKLKSIVANITERGFSSSVMNGVITDSTKLLVSYIVFQGEKTEALKVLIERMEQAGEGVLLRHGTIRKSYNEGVNILRERNTDQLAVSSTDPVVARKIQIKLKNLMKYCTPDKYASLMDDVIEDATMFLAVHLLQPQIIQVCKCMKNVFVQCELWCDEILRRVARPCCTCSRHVSAQALADLAPAQRLRISPGSSRAFAPGLDISLTQCPSRFNKICPAAKPASGCEKMSTSYLLYTTSYNHSAQSPTRLPRQSQSNSGDTSPSSSLSCSMSQGLSPLLPLKLNTLSSNDIRPVRKPEHISNLKPEHEVSDSSSLGSYHTPPTTGVSGASPQSKVNPFWQSPTTMYTRIHKEDIQVRPTISLETGSLRKHQQDNSAYTRTPIISTDQMSDWHAMMVSLMWNVQAWRDWIQENIDKALNYQPQQNVSSQQTTDNWTLFQRRVATEALQWRQYNIFSRQLTLRLALRYRDKQIVSPTRATVKTSAYMECQRDMLEIISMFNRWTQWLTVVLRETDSLQQDADSNIPIHETRWSHFKKKVQEYCEDWSKYNTRLKHSWEHKYRAIISDWLPPWSQRGPVWVVSACGAVPSGAVAAGVFDGEITWVARTTHKCNVMPATLCPSKHCCLVYADGAVHHYTKYQVMCNAEVKWLPWRAGEVGARAVRVAPGIHVGRVHYRGSHLLGAVHAPSYRCHVVIFGRPFAFNCYELLVLCPGDENL